MKSDTRLDPIVSDGEIAVIPGIIGALVFQVDQWSQGYSGLKLNCDFIYEPTDERSGNLRYGFSQMDKVKQEHVAIIREFLEDFESRLKNWEGFMDLEKFFEELKSLRQKLGDELAIIKLKRIVSGRCKYCPL